MEYICSMAFIVSKYYVGVFLNYLTLISLRIFRKSKTMISLKAQII